MAKQAREFSDALQSYLLRRLQEQGLESAAGKLASVRIDKPEYPTISDRLALNEWAKEHDALDLFQARINKQAFNLRVEAGETPDGVEVFKDTKINISPIKKR